MPHVPLKSTPSRKEKHSERLECRVTLTHRLALNRIALEKRRTLSSLIEEFIEELIKANPQKTDK